MDSQYYQKYLKYKTKYCNLSKSIKGGGSYLRDPSANLIEFLKQDVSDNTINSYDPSANSSIRLKFINFTCQ